MTRDTGPLTETAYAKINLALHVRERLPDGYHRIETLFAFCEEGDVLAAEPAGDLSLTIDGPFAEGLSSRNDNLVMRAAAMVRDYVPGGPGAAIRLTKNLPIASGIGGGSADAAAAIRLLARLWQADLDAAVAHDIAADLGADVPACLGSKTVIGRGRGDELEAIALASVESAPALLVNPGVAIPTGPVFQRWDGEDRGALAAERGAGGWRNDLTPPAIAIAPEIGAVLALLDGLPGAFFVRMSGSGATCFALFEDMEKRAQAALSVKSAHPDWWVWESALR
ncbi:4-(cytidine 5'-diphospho)-2-C-methyl-D-erythritol kinase [Parasphingopyxis marina]|uniref:4-diphosphocytidyl-2-C-methyl-D-erythritol kinase n=1 Tax=Parasphingopyxis marina TaxID=2761622 RepID=A0A842I0D6_9SPHN|nr:4-(cytidine 5'-diphospho)-2-C-methyl-D-erythritol kinase [Parasphingopyxis marina]MBC2777640.1 4-(cytidine 5'-diphospho)-2-C-methyl-D-erythritol kinase [Parasphingopyxis marina]